MFINDYQTQTEYLFYTTAKGIIIIIKLLKWN